MKGRTQMQFSKIKKGLFQPRQKQRAGYQKIRNYEIQQIKKDYGQTVTRL